MNSPMFWKYILDTLEAHGLGPTRTVVTGGCIRDYLLGLEPKDIDVVVSVPPGRGNYDYNIPEGWTPLPRGDLPDEYVGNPNIVEIHDYLVAETTVQLIITTNARYGHIERHDLLLTKGAFTIDGGLDIPGTMFTEIQHKRIRASANSATDGTMARAQRFLDKISEFEDGWVVDAEQIRQNLQVPPAAAAPEPRPWAINWAPFGAAAAIENIAALENLQANMVTQDEL